MLVSALMLTGGHETRKPLAMRAVDCFLKQSYPHRELVIINSSPTAPWFKFSRFKIDGISIREYCIKRKTETLGDLRNTSLELAKGELWLTWDDDDYYHPDRITYQVENHKPGHLTLLRYQYRLDLTTGKWGLADGSTTPLGGIIGTMLINPTEHRYRSVNVSEDRKFSRHWLKQGLVNVLENNPELYIRMYHGGNIWNRDHIMGNTRLVTNSQASEYIENVRSIYNANTRPVR